MSGGCLIDAGPEIIDRAIIGAERVVDGGLPACRDCYRTVHTVGGSHRLTERCYVIIPADRTGTVAFVKNKRSVFECHPIEKSRLIYQIGSSDPELALQAAKLVEQDV